MAKKDLSKSAVVARLRKELPPIWERTQTDELTGGVVKARTYANLQSLKQAPKGFRVGRKVVIEREAFLYWLESRLTHGGDGDPPFPPNDSPSQNQINSTSLSPGKLMCLQNPVGPS